LKWISEPDYGQTNALNKGLRMAKGDIICWLNSDDLLFKNAFKNVNNFFNKNLDKNVVVGNLLNVDENEKLLWRSKSQKVSLNGLLNGTQCVQQQSTFFRRKVFKVIGSFDERYHYCMDHEFWVRVAKKFEFYAINVDLAMFRRYKGSKTINHEFEFIKEIIQLKRKHNARIFSYGNLRIFYSVIVNPFKKISVLRKLIRALKGKNPDYIYGGP
jgi:glycosyltransferase involved in cell wall biosynthesis